jgi:hypothetical protein
MSRASHDSTTAYLAMLRRMIVAAGRRVGQADTAELVELMELRTGLEVATQAAVDGLRASGYTWQSIGEATGTSRQAALMKWGRHEGRVSFADA